MCCVEATFGHHRTRVLCVFVALYKTHRQMAEEAVVQSTGPGAGKRTRESRAADTDTCHGESGGEGEGDDDEEDNEDDEEEVDGLDARRTVPRNPYEAHLVDFRIALGDAARSYNVSMQHVALCIYAKLPARDLGFEPES